MKNIVLFAFCINILVNLDAQTIPGFSDDIAGLEAKARSKWLNFKEFKLGDNYDLKYHRCEWRIDPDTTYISGSVTSFFVAEQNNMSSMIFELSSYLTVDSVKYHGNLASFTHSPGDELQINFPLPLPTGTFDSVSVYYHGVPGAGIGFGSFIKDFHNGIPIIWTLSEPYGAKDWWPCKNSLSDKIDSIDIIVTTPSINRVGSNGLLVEEYFSGPDKVYHWKHRYPITTYLVAIAVTNYSVYSDYSVVPGGTVEVLNYVYPEDLSTWQLWTPRLIDVIHLYDSLFGEYPFINEKYGHAQFNWGGGMEHQTMTFCVNASYELIAHELSHQWFGNKVTCGSWHDIWVNESTATYLSALALEYLDPVWWPIWKRQRIDYVTSDSTGSVYCYDTTSVARIFDGRLSYNKGGLVLHMVRWITGDTVFYQAMSSLMSEPQHAYGFAKTTDMQEHFETYSGINFTEFFNDWIYDEGHPIYTINCNYIYDSLQLTIYQGQSHPSVSFFEMPVPIRFWNSINDTIVVFDNTFSGQTYNFRLGFIPDSMQFDPELWLLARLDTSILTGIKDIPFQQTGIYPNPVQTTLNFETPGILAEGGTIFLYQTDGKCILAIPVESGSFSNALDLSDYKPGTYIIKIQTPDRFYTCTIVKM